MRKGIVTVFFILLLTRTVFADYSFSSITQTFSQRSRSASLPPIDWTHYHNYTETVAILLALNQTYPGIVDVFSIGKSHWSRDIYAVRLTNESDTRQKPEVFFVGYHHAREPITSEVGLYFLVYAATNFGLNATVTDLINKSEVYVVVALNVDGFDLFEANDWQRKNARPTKEDQDLLVDEDPPEDEDGDGFIEQLIDYTDPGNPVFVRWEGTDNDADGKYAEDWVGGVDLNRNYDYEWQHGTTSPGSETYRGPSPFSEPETQAIRDFVLAHDFRYAISFHSGTEVILYPWGSTTLPPPDEAKFIEIAQELSAITGGTFYQQASDMYFTYGVWDDWMYGVAGVYALTCEIFTNYTYPGFSHPGPSPNTYWEGGLKYWFNPFPSGVESVIQRWLPVFFNITGRAILESSHDVAVSLVKLDKTVVSQGYLVELNVTLRNKGYTQETLELIVQANSTVIHTENVLLDGGQDADVTFLWNTTGFAKGNYEVSASVTPVSNETNTADNSYASSIIVSMVGDLNYDGVVDIFDITTVAVAFGASPVDANWSPNTDVVNDDLIDIFDIVIVALHFGDVDP